MISDVTTRVGPSRTGASQCQCLITDVHTTAGEQRQRHPHLQVASFFPLSNPSSQIGFEILRAEPANARFMVEAGDGACIATLLSACLVSFCFSPRVGSNPGFTSLATPTCYYQRFLRIAARIILFYPRSISDTRHWLSAARKSGLSSRILFVLRGLDQQQVEMTDSSLPLPSIETSSIECLAGSYDYIIVGGGTSGLVIASRLTEDPNVTVLVLEAGSDKLHDSRITTPGLALAMWDNPEFDWQFMTTPQVYPRKGTYPDADKLAYYCGAIG